MGGRDGRFPSERGTSSSACANVRTRISSRRRSAAGFSGVAPKVTAMWRPPSSDANSTFDAPLGTLAASRMRTSSAPSSRFTRAVKRAKPVSGGGGGGGALDAMRGPPL